MVVELTLFNRLLSSMGHWPVICEYHPSKNWWNRRNTDAVDRVTQYGPIDAGSADFALVIRSMAPGRKFEMTKNSNAGLLRQKKLSVGMANGDLGDLLI